MPTIQVEVSAEVAGIIAAKVADGSYDSADSYITEAVQHMEDARTHQDEEAKLAELKRIINKSLRQADAGDVAPYSYELMKAHLKNSHV